MDEIRILTPVVSETAQPGCQLPEDLILILEELGNSEGEAGRLVEGLTDLEINWQANLGKTWSIAQCLDHLAKTNTLYTEAIRAAVHEVPPGKWPREDAIQPGWFERQFINSMDAPPRRKFRAPKKAVPANYKTREEVLTAFSESHQQIRSLLAECVSIDLNGVHFKNPFIRLVRFTVGTGLLLIAAHERRHLLQATQVRSSIERCRTSA
jgi:DinB superfamily